MYKEVDQECCKKGCKNKWKDRIPTKMILCHECFLKEIEISRPSKYRILKKTSYGIIIYGIPIFLVWYYLGPRIEILCVMFFLLGIFLDKICEWLSDLF